MGVSLVKHLHILPHLTLGESIFQGSYSLTAEDGFTKSLNYTELMHVNTKI